MYYQENHESLEPLLFVCNITADMLLKGANLDEYLTWAQNSLPTLIPEYFAQAEHLDTKQQKKIAYWIGVSLWNAAPQPNYQYQTRPLPKPARNDDCPCGSGQKYKRCCSHISVLKFDTSLFWYSYAETMTKSLMLEESRNGNLPLEAVTIFATYLFMSQDYSTALKLTLNTLENAGNTRDELYDAILNLYCDCCDEHYVTQNKKRKILERMSGNSNPILKSAAWQRLATMYLDEENPKAALDALNHALRATPNNPSIALLEIMLLVNSGQAPKAKQRATFWYRKLRNKKDTPPELLETLEAAQHEPEVALHRATNDVAQDVVDILIMWVKQTENYPIAPYRTQLQKIDTQQQDLFEDNEDFREHQKIEHQIMSRAVTLEPAPKAKKLERNWITRAPAFNLFSTQTTSPELQQWWADISETENIMDSELDWLDWLVENPSAANLFSVLDTVVLILDSCPDFIPTEPFFTAIEILTDRAFRIVQASETPDDATLPWVMTENRPLMRLLMFRIVYCKEADMIKNINDYLALNPHDNHGYRETLVDEYLKNGDNQRALELCNNYPDDIMASVAYGRILSNLRLGNFKLAEQAWQDCHEHLPKVAEYLVQKKVRKPKIDEDGLYTIGGEQQAWNYRQSMRAAWQSDKSHLRWLSEQMAKSN